jgi:hypothetical protein
MAVGPFRLEDAHTLTDLEKASDPSEYVIPLEHARDLLAAWPVPVPPRP